MLCRVPGCRGDERIDALSFSYSNATNGKMFDISDVFIPFPKKRLAPQKMRWRMAGAISAHPPREIQAIRSNHSGVAPSSAPGDFGSEPHPGKFRRGNCFTPDQRRDIRTLRQKIRHNSTAALRGGVVLVSVSQTSNGDACRANRPSPIATAQRPTAIRSLLC